MTLDQPTPTPTPTEDAPKPTSERALRALVHAGNWVEQRGAFSVISPGGACGNCAPAR